MTLVITPHIRQPAATTCILSALSPIRPLKGETAACAGSQDHADKMIEHAHEREHAHMPYMSCELLRVLLRLEKLLQIHLDQSAAEGHSAQLRWRRIERSADEEEHCGQHLRRGRVPSLVL